MYADRYTPGTRRDDASPQGRRDEGDADSDESTPPPWDILTALPVLEPGRRDNGRSRPRAVDNSDWPIPGPNAGLLDRNGGDGGPTRQTQRRRQEEEKETRRVAPKEWWEDVGLARDIASANDRVLSDLMMRVARLEQRAEETSRQIATAEAMATVSTTHDTPSPFPLSQ